MSRVTSTVGRVPLEMTAVSEPAPALMVIAPTFPPGQAAVPEPNWVQVPFALMPLKSTTKYVWLSAR